jgi:hypothetical protein
MTDLAVGERMIWALLFWGQKPKEAKPLDVLGA